jgi:transmembrane sensor
MQQDKLNKLVQCYLNNQLNENELDEFFYLLDKGMLDDYLEEQILYQLKRKEETEVFLPFDVSDHIIRNISSAANFATQATTIKKQPAIKKYIKYAIAASFIGLVAIISYLYLAQSNNSKQLFSKNFKQKNKQYQYNNSNTKLKIELSDNSIIVLEPGASINYSSFEGEKREVYLEGDAFFEVAKNKEKPFLVYTGSIVTKVLGTSFNVRNNVHNGNTEVEVKSGKVQVLPNVEILKEKALISQTAILIPNHKALFKETEKILETGLVAEPLLVKKINNYISIDTGKVSFLFNRQHLREIINDFNTHYGIEIVVENEELNNCVFTGDVSEQGLYDKLKIICLTINANYELNGTKILITGKGCGNINQ